MAERRWIASLCVAVLAVAFTCLFFIDLCNLIYQCRCDHLWAAQAAHCNIHGAHGRRCPWCQMPLESVGLVILGIVTPQALLAFRPAAWPWWKRLLASLAAFPVIGTAHGLLIGWLYGYWR
jgi:hypothetical protein